ncbi:P74 [Lonomia obliqua multiple nucleopolyhedrovirus]|uniref:p74 n=1 Tax=Lonomia obliqua multiple nucleopolyhedrovirus TaxID=134394 RepID=A0A126FC92_9ABAC|nr:P74 [Lonomia obliqua multiple nucleopolyhedrovirus]AKN81020.1 P74 [Lonomia obliqua multiple nucleopolyhedrovirus]
MSVLTAVDLTNASRYAIHMHRLEFISRWRARFPNILINYTLRPASNDNDYYVPPKLADRALAVRLAFSKRGCDSMSCYPFHETGVVNNLTPFMYTQTSETSIGYAQPACYHLDRAAAMRDGAENEVQSAEFTYTTDNKCILVDSLSKMYFNSPYLRTEEHTIMGVDDVPAFNVKPDSDILFPERFEGEFNEAYCRRFGRELFNGGCSFRWWESLIGFILGDTIYVTFKMLANNIFTELNSFDYKAPSPILPPRPIVDSNRILNDWRNVRDSVVDLEFEKLFNQSPTLEQLGLIVNNTMQQLTYTAEVGFSKSPILSSDIRNVERRAYESHVDALDRSISDSDLESIITSFLEDYSLVFGIATDIGFDMLLSGFKSMLKKINTTLIPALKRMLVNTTRRVTVRMLGETYKAAMVHTLNVIAIKTLTTTAKALTRLAIQASSIIGIVLILLTLADLVLALWDPFGYNNMFPREFPDDMSRTFLTAYFESFDNTTTREMVEFMPEFFSTMVETDDDATFRSLYHLLDYVASLEVNSDGQMLNLNEGSEIKDFDEATLVGQALASSSLYTRLEFYQYTFRQNTILTINKENNKYNKILMGLFILNTSIALTAFIMHTELIFFFIFVVFLMIALYYLIRESYEYYKTIDAVFAL